MASQRDIKRRIDSVRNTRKITRAMELVASAKLRRAQESIEALRPYAQAMRRLMSQAARQSGGTGISELPLLERAAGRGARGDRRRSPATAAWRARSTSTSCARRSCVADELRAEGFEEVEFTAVGKKGAGTLAVPPHADRQVFQGFSVDPTSSRTPST